MDAKAINELRAALEAATRRAEQAEQALEAIYSGAADALVVPAAEGPQVYIREGADRPYRTIVELMAQGVAICDGEGRILRANYALGELLGRPAEQVIGRVIGSLVASESARELEAMVAEARSRRDRVEDEVLMLQGPGGRPRPVLVGVSSLDLDRLDAFMVSLTDLSRQKRADELLASERLARSIIDQAVDAIIVCDPEGRVLRASREALRLCGGNPLRQVFDAILPLYRVTTGPDGTEQSRRAPSLHGTGRLGHGPESGGRPRVRVVEGDPAAQRRADPRRGGPDAGLRRHPDRRDLSEGGRDPAAGGRPPQGRVPGDACPRVAQPPGRDGVWHLAPPRRQRDRG